MEERSGRIAYRNGPVSIVPRRFDRDLLSLVINCGSPEITLIIDNSIPLRRCPNGDYDLLLIRIPEDTESTDSCHRQGLIESIS